MKKLPRRISYYYEGRKKTDIFIERIDEYMGDPQKYTRKLTEIIQRRKTELTRTEE